MSNCRRCGRVLRAGSLGVRWAGVSTVLFVYQVASHSDGTGKVSATKKELDEIRKGVEEPQATWVEIVVALGIRLNLSRSFSVSVMLFTIPVE